MKKQKPIYIKYNKLMLRLMVPLTPSLNQTLRWNRTMNLRRILEHGRAQKTAVWACLVQAYGPQWKKPLAQKVRLHVVRCTGTSKFLDETNLIGGLKATEDAMVSLGIMPDDSPEHTSWGEIRQLKKKEWEEYHGPATHIFVERIK
jgi:hypothetical protein